LYSNDLCNSDEPIDSNEPVGPFLYSPYILSEACSDTNFRDGAGWNEAGRVDKMVCGSTKSEK